MRLRPPSGKAATMGDTPPAAIYADDPSDLVREATELLRAADVTAAIAGLDRASQSIHLGDSARTGMAAAIRSLALADQHRTSAIDRRRSGDAVRADAERNLATVALLGAREYQLILSRHVGPAEVEPRIDCWPPVVEAMRLLIDQA